jgi:hypothetical protein
LTTDLSVTRVTEPWCVTIETVERMLATRIEYENQQNMPLSGAVFQRKARHLYEVDAKEQTPFDAV